MSENPKATFDGMDDWLNNFDYSQISEERWRYFDKCFEQLHLGIGQIQRRRLAKGDLEFFALHMWRMRAILYDGFSKMQQLTNNREVN